MTGWDELRERLDDGLHLENLRSLRAGAYDLALHAEAPLAAYLIAGVLWDLETRWNDVPVEVSEIEGAEATLIPLLARAIDAAQGSGDATALGPELDQLVLGLMDLLKAGLID